MPAESTVPKAAKLAAGALLVVAGLAVLWTPPVLPGLDTPHNLVAAWIAAHPDQYRGWFEPNWPFALLVQRVLLAAVFHLAPPLVALKIARSIELLAIALGSLAAWRRVGASASVVT